MNELAEDLKVGKTDYSELVDEISKKYMEVKGKDLGYITVFSLPYEMENQVYELKTGGITKGISYQIGFAYF
jgi:hypothetical protein